MCCDEITQCNDPDPDPDLNAHVAEVSVGFGVETCTGSEPSPPRRPTISEIESIRLNQTSNVSLPSAMKVLGASLRVQNVACDSITELVSGAG